MSLSSIEFLPSNLREDEFFSYFAGLVDWIQENYQDVNVDLLEAMFFPLHPEYLTEKYILEIMGYDTIPATSYGQKALSLFAGDLIKLRGTTVGEDILASILAS